MNKTHWGITMGFFLISSLVHGGYLNLKLINAHEEPVKHARFFYKAPKGTEYRPISKVQAFDVLQRLGNYSQTLNYRIGQPVAWPDMVSVKVVAKGYEPVTFMQSFGSSEAFKVVELERERKGRHGGYRQEHPERSEKLSGLDIRLSYSGPSSRNADRLAASFIRNGADVTVTAVDASKINTVNLHPQDYARFVEMADIEPKLARFKVYRDRNAARGRMFLVVD